MEYLFLQLYFSKIGSGLSNRAQINAKENIEFDKIFSSARCDHGPSAK